MSNYLETYYNMPTKEERALFVTKAKKELNTSLITISCGWNKGWIYTICASVNDNSKS